MFSFRRPNKFSNRRLRRDTQTFYMAVVVFVLYAPAREARGFHELLAIYAVQSCRVTVLVAWSRHCCYTVFVPNSLQRLNPSQPLSSEDSCA